MKKENISEMKQLARDIHANSVKHGWWDTNPSSEHFLALVVCELAEAIEAARCNKRARVRDFEKRLDEPSTPNETATKEQIYAYWFKTYIKDSIEDELADAYIRLMDLAAGIKMKWEKWSKWKNPYDKDNVKSDNTFTENIYTIIKLVAHTDYQTEAKIKRAAEEIEQLAYLMDIDLKQHIVLKMRYNVTREYKHGKAF